MASALPESVRHNNKNLTVMRVRGQGYIYAMSKTIFDMTAVKNIVKTVIKWIILSKTSKTQYQYNKYILCDK